MIIIKLTSREALSWSSFGKLFFPSVFALGFGDGVTDLAGLGPRASEAFEYLLLRGGVSVYIKLLAFFSTSDNPSYHIYIKGYKENKQINNSPRDNNTCINNRGVAKSDLMISLERFERRPRCIDKNRYR
jgi:hypothetical protein